MEQLENKKGFKVGLIVFLVSVLLISGVVSYAYFTGVTKTTGSGNVTTSTTVVNANTSIETTGTLEFNDSDIYPGHKNVSTIKVVATGLDEVDYNVIWTGTNSFTTTLNYYVYKITTEESPSITCEKKTGLVNNVTTYYEECTNNNFDNLGSVVASGEITTLEESTKIELIKNESIQATNEGATVYYHVVIEYPNKEEGQNQDFNASINGEVSVEVSEPLLGSEYILAKKNIVEMPSITGIASEDTTGTVYSVADDDGTSYVYRGAPTDNWVSFGGYYWRIIRVNGDGSIRMIYNGTSTTTTGEGTQIATGEYNTSYNDNAYVGFMYGQAGASTYEATHANTNKSTIMSQLESWYTSSGLSNYAQYIDQNAGFCNDRGTSSTAFSGYGALGYGTNETGYAPPGRLLSNGSWKTTQTPSLKCSQASSDLFTPTNSTKGNKKLSVPVGLITSDEVVYAGGFGGANNTSYYLYTNQAYWTMSPYSFAGSYAFVFRVNSSGYLSNSNVNIAYGVRPVINLRSDVTLTGSGLANNPYKIEGAV